ncbi:phage tail protein [Providencia stuartii]|uniref:phage tail protein n=1 Tax=Providencia stuartii TaxID=588 RepID=UPI002989D58E|nr:phage tail protein [Providencia stuartii]
MKYFALLTKLGENLLAQATALGTKIELTHMAVGDGGGSLPTPDTNQTKLIAEKRRAAINTLFIDDKNKNQIIAEQIIPESEGGWWIREIGLFDKAGNLIAVANCPETYKPQLAEGSGRTQSIRMVLIVSHTESVTLKIDPAVVLATRDYVNKGLSCKQDKGNYADGARFKTTTSNVAMSPIAGSISLILQTDGTLFTWDGSKSVFRISSAGEITNGSMPYPRLTGVPIVQSTGGSTTSFMSQKATTDAIASAQAAFPEASTTNKGKVQLAASTGQSTSLVMHQKAVTDAIEARQPIGNYADGTRFKTTTSNVAMSPIAGSISLILQTDGTLFTWDGSKSVFRISSAGEITNGSMPYPRLTGVPIVQSTGGSTTSFMSQKATTDAIASAQAAFPEASTTNKGKVQLAASTGQSTSLVMHQKAVTDAIEARQPIGNYADGTRFKTTTSNVAMSPIAGDISLVLQNDGKLFLWDGARSIFEVSHTGEITKGTMAYSRLTGVPLNTLFSEDNGYWRCKDTGFMIQWGRAAVNGFVNFPIPFPKALFSFSGIHVGDNAVPVRISAERSTLKGIDIAQSTTGQIGMRWIAIGF